MNFGPPSAVTTVGTPEVSASFTAQNAGQYGVLHFGGQPIPLVPVADDEETEVRNTGGDECLLNSRKEMNILLNGQTTGIANNKCGVRAPAADGIEQRGIDTPAHRKPGFGAQTGEHIEQLTIRRHDAIRHLIEPAERLYGAGFGGPAQPMTQTAGQKRHHIFQTAAGVFMEVRMPGGAD